MKLSEKIARIICQGCDDDPDGSAGEFGHTYRWEDYEPIAVEVITALVFSSELAGRTEESE